MGFEILRVLMTTCKNTPQSFIWSLKPDNYINIGSDLSFWSSLECVVHACTDNNNKKTNHDVLVEY